nr:CPBP family intramembrane glutamic endopeptidase [Canibacter zhuwentaonis]
MLVALCEEFVFRALVLGSLLHEWELPKAVAAGLVAIAFGLSHWYYGVRQVALKLIIGSALVWAALFGGWVSAVLAHVALNVALTAISAWRRRA